MPPPVALITGAAQRIGATIAHRLHEAGYRVAVHYRSSGAAALAMCNEFNRQRPDSACAIEADMGSTAEVNAMAESLLERWQRLDLLVNNASGFFPTPVGRVSEADWDALMGSNLKGPFFLAQALAPTLKENGGAIVNMLDIYASQPLPGHSVYSMAKAGLLMMTRALAAELAPQVRVNGIAPGAILWPEADDEFGRRERKIVRERVPLQRTGEPEDIARTVLFLADDAPYITGQIIAVDGGRTLSI